MDNPIVYLLKKNLLPILLGLAGLGFVAIGLFQLYSQKKNAPAVTFQPASETKTSTSPEQVIVDVEGAVLNPGVYKLSSESRFVDALAAAGGLSKDADRDYAEKNINLAKKVTDGLKIYIPREGEKILSGSDSSSGQSSTININTAGASELDTLPAVGAVTAQKIIDARPYATIEELLQKKIVGQATYDKIKDRISAN